MWQKYVIHHRTDVFNSLLLFVPHPTPHCILLLHPLPQSFYSSLGKNPEPYRVIFSHPAHLYHPTQMCAFPQSQTPNNPTHTQLEPVDLSLSKRSSSSASSSSSPPCSAACSPASSRSSPPSPYCSASRASPRCSPPLHSQLHSSPSHALPTTTPSLPYPTMVAPLISSGPGVIQGSGVMVSPVMLPLSAVLYPSSLHLHQPIMVSPPISSDEDHHRSREHKTGEDAFVVCFLLI